MKILTKLMLASAVMVTSGFAAPDVGTTVLEGKNSAELNGDFKDTNYVARNGGAINVKVNTTVPAERSLTIESKGVGTVENGVVLSNEGVAAMHWADAVADRGLVAGAGSINQVIVEGGPKTIKANFDRNGEAEWYVYNYENDNVMVI